MKHHRYIVVLLMLINLSAFYQFSFCQVPKNDRLKIAADMESSMINNLLKQWYPQSIDSRYGGFLSTFSYDFKPVGDQDKMIVTQARHTWSNSKAAEIFPGVAYF